jgi:hypothetical protein
MVILIRWRPKTSGGKVSGVLTSCNINGNLSQWHGSTGKLLFEYPNEDRAGYLCMDYSKFGKLLITGAKDYQVKSTITSNN